MSNPPAPPRPPTFDELVQDPARVADLSDREVRQLLLRVSALLTALAARAPASENGQPEEDRLLAPAEAAARLGIRLSRVRELTRSGALPSVKIGKYVRIRPTALAQWLAEQEAKKPLSFGRSVAYSSAYARGRAPTHPPETRAEPGRLRRGARGSPELRGPARKERNRDQGTSGPARPAPGGQRPAPAPDEASDETRW